MRLTFTPVSIIGSGSFDKLGEEAALLGKRALIVTGMGSLRRSGGLDRALAILKRNSVEAVVYEGVMPEPQLSAVDEARRIQREQSCDVIIGIGGGSAIDVAKAAGALGCVEEPVAEFFTSRPVPRTALPVAAVPTTSGTGAEATRNSVLLDPALPEKKSIRGDTLMPRLAIVDGDLTLTCPPDVTAHSGMDALCQALESFFSIKAIPATMALSAKSVELIAGSLTTAYEDGTNRAARMAMAEGSFLAGVALCNAGLGAVHGLAHPIGALFHVPHGLVCAVLLPVVMELNWGVIRDRAGELASFLGSDPAGKVRSIMSALGLPERFDFRPDETQMKHITDYALTAGSSKSNPVKVDENYIREAMKRSCRP